MSVLSRRKSSNDRKDLCGITDSDLFNTLLCLERKRSERTGDPFALALLDIVGLKKKEQISAVCAALGSGTRETDIAGWYDYPSIIGIMFTALNGAAPGSIVSTLKGKVDQALRRALDAREYGKIPVTLHLFPADVDEKLYPDITNSSKSRVFHEVLKRAVDVAGGLFALVLFSPLFLIIPVLLKLSSKGPVLFKQRRLGQWGKEFNFLKFRTMYVNTSAQLHQQYVRDLIQAKTKSNGVYKIVDDPRVTPLGHILRKTSLDELPQFINVLKGDMSLVGPRPPIPYEVEVYKCWHKRRVIEVKPGITGLWQVHGRSRTTFDEMVRLDLRYVRERSLWLDLKILLKTPGAIVTGSGAY